MNPPTRQRTTASMRNWLQDIGRVGAHGHPQPDLAGPLGDGDEHDVHDAHAAHDQRHGGHRQCPGPESIWIDAFQDVGDLGVVVDAEIGFVLGQTVPVAQQAG